MALKRAAIRHAVPIAGHLTHQVIHHDFIVAFQLAAQGVGQQFLYQIAGNVDVSSGDVGLSGGWICNTERSFSPSSSSLDCSQARSR